jgi:hypothetical protein
VKKTQNGRKSLRMLKPTVGCNVNKTRRNITLIGSLQGECRVTVPWQVTLSVTVAAFCLQIECRWENSATALCGVGKCGAAVGK